MKNFILGFIIIVVAYSFVKINNLETLNQTTVITSSDGYKFHSKEYENEHVLVTVKTFKTRKEFNDIAKQLGVKVDYGEEQLVAFTYIEEDSRFCTIYMVDQSIEYRPAFVGHEFLHCVYGQWHISNDSKGIK